MERSLKRNKIIHTLFSVTGLIILGKLLGFIKQMFVAARFGTTAETDVFSLAEGLIANTQYLLVQVLLTSFTAVYIHTREKNEAEAKRFAMDTLQVFSLIAALLAAVIAALSGPIARLIAPSYSAELSGQVAGYIRAFAPLLILFVWIAIFHALLNSNERFIPGEFTSVNQSVITVLLVLLLSSVFGVKTLALALAAYTVFNALFLGLLARKYVGHSRGKPFQNENVRGLIRMAGPLLLGYSVIYINQQVDKILVSGLEAGTVTAMGYAAVLSNLVSTFIVTFCSILFTYVTTAIAGGDHKKAALLSNHTALILMIVFLPISVLSIVEAEDIVYIVFGRGAFDARSVEAAAAALCGYSFTFVPLVVKEVYSRILYGYKDSKSPMISSSVSIAVNIALSIALCPRFGVFGVTLASSISVAVCAVLNVAAAGKRSPAMGSLMLLPKLPVLAVGTLVCCFAARWSMSQFASLSVLPRFILASLCGCCAYFVVTGPMIYKTYFKENGLSIFGISRK